METSGQSFPFQASSLDLEKYSLIINKLMDNLGEEVGRGFLLFVFLILILVI